MGLRGDMGAFADCAGENFVWDSSWTVDEPSALSTIDDMER